MSTKPTTATSWATGIARFAGLAMALLGVLYIVTGTGALFQSTATVPGLVHVFSIDAVTWSWIHIVAGTLLGLAGMAVITGMLWGRVIGIAPTAVAIGVGFLSLSHHPTLSILGIMLPRTVRFPALASGRRGTWTFPSSSWLSW